jgi:dihydroorotase
MSNILIQNGRLIDPSQSIDRTMSLRIEGGKIVAYDVPPADGDQVIDASGKIVAPGLIDMHVHFREPGFEEDETIETGTRAALSGGFTSVACCPNTIPPIDTQGTVEYIRQKAARARHCHVFVIACVSRNREGKELAELGQLFEVGAVACSDDGSPVENAELMRRAFEYALMFDRPVLNHPETPSLTANGVMHEGKVSLQLGLRGIPAAAEDVMVSRDVTLAELTGGKLHVMHVSTSGSVQAVRRAKSRGVRVTSEVTPHHLCLTDESLRSFDANFKMNPPLRGREHVEACIEGLKDGTIDAIVTDHAPHAVEKKMRELDEAPFGIIGLETALGVLVTHLIEPGHLDWPTFLEKLTRRPAEILSLEKGTLQIGADADVTIIDPAVKWTVSPDELCSKSRNTPFMGKELTGRATHVIVDGELRFSRT